MFKIYGVLINEIGYTIMLNIFLGLLIAFYFLNMRYNSMSPTSIRLSAFVAHVMIAS